MKSILLLFFSASVLLGIISCTKTPDYPKEPQITYKGSNKSTIRQGSRFASPDTLIITFSFTDGDGDLGDNDTTTNEILMYDSRDSALNPGQIRPIPEEGSGNGISGEIEALVPNFSKIQISGSDTIGLGNVCCVFPDRRTCFTDPRFPRDTFSYLIQIRDRAGNYSNVIRTETFTILCN